MHMASIPKKHRKPPLLACHNPARVNRQRPRPPLSILGLFGSSTVLSVRDQLQEVGEKDRRPCC